MNPNVSIVSHGSSRRQIVIASTGQFVIVDRNGLELDAQFAIVVARFVSRSVDLFYVQFRFGDLQDLKQLI